MNFDEIVELDEINDDYNQYNEIDEEQKNNNNNDQNSLNNSEDNVNYSNELTMDEMIGMQVTFLDSDEEIKNYLNSEEVEQQLLLKDEEEYDYKYLYSRMYHKAFILIRLLKKNMDKLEQNEQNDLQIKEHQFMQKKKISRLTQEKSKLNDDIFNLKEKLEQQQTENQIKNIKMKSLERKIQELNQEISLYDQENLIGQNNIVQIITKMQQENYQLEALNEFDYKHIEEAQEVLQQINLTINKYKKQKIQKLLEKNKHKDGIYCIICETNKVNIMLRPCNHLCLCSGCAAHLIECPMDRKFILEREKVYL